MKTIKAICTAAVLAITLSISVYAGQINSPGIACPATGCPDPEPSPGEVSIPPAALTSPEACALLELLLAIIPIV
jgi:hypothetical protein